ncbi:prepilin-type N-terminal cleavage/methylation domain-containing protein [Aeromonas caviae]|uniref:MSHA biogenesis protein MshA n=1 Tax=Aeromonas caviae TaxID=648 RepID=A0A6S4T0L0_AERCA|nr:MULTISPECIES: prepilin-type N-terminal cleavage/methylation domain-containing protein [Aeromonas]MDX7737762.1 prepilin-type N-terminal cleavage/methylation domain-containing protein [Aeromonas caviae]OCW46905.1 hypothetical protein A6763_12315 [Aeromonas caviae]BBQ28710.1 hypothetical protein WP2W18E01_02920 [Aeromonas caviae]
MKKQAGFTLIELVIVIIILGILAVTAAPKFLNLQDDANKAAAQGVAAAVKSGAQLAFSRSAIDGTEKMDRTEGASVAVGTGHATIAFGYPQATSAGIGMMVSLDGGWTLSKEGNGTAAAEFTSDQANSCTVTYQEAQAEGEAFKVAVTGDNCD